MKSHKHRVYLDVITGFVKKAEDHIPSEIMGCVDSIYFCLKNPHRFIRLEKYDTHKEFKRRKAELIKNTYYFPSSSDLEFRVQNNFQKPEAIPLTKEQMHYRMIYLLRGNNDLTGLWHPSKDKKRWSYFKQKNWTFKTIK